jgi:hypothetical protein
MKKSTFIWAVDIWYKVRNSFQMIPPEVAEGAEVVDRNPWDVVDHLVVPCDEETPLAMAPRLALSSDVVQTVPPVPPDVPPAFSQLSPHLGRSPPELHFDTLVE